MASYITILVFLSLMLLSCDSCRLLTETDLLQKECKQATQFMTPARCVQLLSTDPKASKATNFKELAIIGLQLAVAESSKVHDKIIADAASSKHSADVKSVLNQVATEVKAVNGSFRSALSEATDGDFQSANYDCFSISDSISSAQEELKKVQGKVDASYVSSIDTLKDFSLVGYVLTNH